MGSRRGSKIAILAALMAGVSPMARAVVATATDGIAWFEAEHADGVQASGGQSWRLTNEVAGFSGAGYMQALPNLGSNINASIVSTSPGISFTLDIPVPGTYQAWVRAYAVDGTEDSLHIGLDGVCPASGSNLNWSAYSAWVWTNGAARSVTVAAPGAHTFHVWMREDGARLDRVVLVTNAAFRPVIGNAFHIPSNYEADLPRPTMRFPLRAIDPDTAVEIYSGNQFRGPGNPGNQLGVGSAVFYKVATNSTWTELPMAFVAQGNENTNNKYFGAVIPADTFKAGDVVQYYLRVPYDDHLPTYLYGTDEARNETEFESVAQAAPYVFTVGSGYLAVTTTVAQGSVEARIYTNAGDLAVIGPGLDGAPGANRLYFTPYARIGGGLHAAGRVTGWFPVPGGYEVSQELHTGIVTARLTVASSGVVRYEIIHFGSMPIEETMIASPSDAGEHFFGLGEKFNSVDQAGRNVRILTWDPAGAKGDLSYKVVPWFLSTRGYGFHLDSTALSYFDLRASSGNRYMVSNKFASLAFNIVYGPELDEALVRFTGYTGRPAMTPPWAYGAWMSSDHWRDGGELRYVVTRMRELNIPGSVFVFDSPWEIAYNDLAWNMTQFAAGGTYEGSSWSGFASLSEMMTFFRSNGWKIVCWMTPFINVNSNNEGVPGANLGVASTYAFASNNGYLVRNGSINGPALVAPWWKGNGSPVDFTRPAAAQWWMMQLSNLIAQSGGVIGGWKTDDGETSNGGNVYIPETAHYADGRTGREMQNGYCVEYHRTVWNVLGTNGVLFARSGFTGSQAYPGYWSGDNEPNFGQENGLLSVMVAGQSAGLSGFSIWGHDIGGYQVQSNPSINLTNLFMRWTQFGAFSPLFQLHRQVAGNQQYPWSYGAAAVDNYREYARLHQALFPYIYTYAKMAADTGRPIIRHPVLMHPADTNTYGINHAYYFGDAFYVAPATAPNQVTRTLYLPPGRWNDYWTNRVYTGPGLMTWTNTDQTKMAVFVREGAIIPMLPGAVQTLLDAGYVGHTNLAMPGDALEFVMYPAASSSFTLYDDTSAHCASNGTVVRATITALPREIRLRIRGSAPAGVQLDGQRMRHVADAAALELVDAGWWYDASAEMICVRYPHAGGTRVISFGPDSVGDGIPDSWLDYFWNDPLATGELACATCDADGDGVENRDEYIAGTDPGDAASVQRVDSASVLFAENATSFALSWPGQPGVPYRVQWRDGMGPESSWSQTTSILIGTGGALSWIDHGAESTNLYAPLRFYRVSSGD